MSSEALGLTDGLADEPWSGKVKIFLLERNGASFQAWALPKWCRQKPLDSGHRR